MKNKYIKGTRISERKFREVVKYFAHDVSVLTASKLCGLSHALGVQFVSMSRKYRLLAMWAICFG